VYRRAALAMFLAGFSTFSLLYWPQSLLPLMARSWAVTPAAASGLIATSTMAMAVMLIPASLLSDRFGRKNIMSLAMLLAALFTLAMAFATSFHALLVLRFLTGLVLAGLPAVAMTYLSEEVESTALASAMGLYISGTALGGMSGRLLSAWAAESWGSAGAALTVGLCGLLAAIGFLLLLAGIATVSCALVAADTCGSPGLALIVIAIIARPRVASLMGDGFCIPRLLCRLLQFHRLSFGAAPIFMGIVSHKLSVLTLSFWRRCLRCIWPDHAALGLFTGLASHVAYVDCWRTLYIEQLVGVAADGYGSVHISFFCRARLGQQCCRPAFSRPSGDGGSYLPVLLLRRCQCFWSVAGLGLA